MNLDSALEGILDATNEDRFPRVLESRVVHGLTVTIVEPCLDSPDGATERGYSWLAVVGTFTTRQCETVDGRRIPGTAVGGDIIATSTTSADRCMTNAIRVINARVARLG